MKDELLRMEIRKLMRIMIDLERQAELAECYDNTRRAGELWAQRLTVQLARSALMRDLWARQGRYEKAS